MSAVHDDAVTARVVAWRSGGTKKTGSTDVGQYDGSDELYLGLHPIILFTWNLVKICDATKSHLQPVRTALFLSTPTDRPTCGFPLHTSHRKRHTHHVVRQALRPLGMAISPYFSCGSALMQTFIQENTRSVGLLAIAKENKLDIELVETKPPVESDDYKKLNRLGKIPTFVGSDGFLLTENIAIAVYCKYKTVLQAFRGCHHCKDERVINLFSYPWQKILVDYLIL